MENRSENRLIPFLLPTIFGVIDGVRALANASNPSGSISLRNLPVWIVSRLQDARIGMPQQRSPEKPFSTRFLSSDGIPEYNALLDEHLGKRREYLLGNKKSLELLQQTGVIARIERQHDNPTQYVVHVTSNKAPVNQPSRHLRRKRPPSLPDAEPTSSSASRDHEAMWRALPPYGSKSTFMLRNSATTPDLGVSERIQAMRTLGGSSDKSQTDDDEEERTKHQEDREELMKELEEEKEFTRLPSASSDEHDIDTFAGEPVNSISVPVAGRLQLPPSTTTARVAALKNLGRSHSTMTIVRKPSVATPSSRESLSDLDTTFLPAVSEKASRATRHRSRSVTEVTPSPLANNTDNLLPTRHSIKTNDLKAKAGPSTASCGPKTTVEHLLESDAAFVAQIRVMKDQLAELTIEKSKLDDEIANVRRKLRGVNAVHENDVAVAHCAAIMQQRLAKAEEEYMKLVTSQQQVKTAVDRVRRELLSLKTVRRKLETDIDDVQRSNAAIEDKIHATKAIRNALSEELTSLERQAEQEREERKLALPPEEAVVVNVERLMNVAASVRPPSSPCKDPPPVLLDDPPPISTSTSSSTFSHPRSGSKKDILHRSQPIDYISAFDKVREALRCSTGPSEFAAAFCATEEQLLAKYRASLAMKDELAAVQKEQDAISNERAARHATIRGSMQMSATAELALQHKVHAMEARIASYNEMREARNQEHAQLRVVMTRCLEILQAESMLASILPTLQTKRSLPSTPSSSSLLSAMGSSGNLLTSGPGGVGSGTRPIVMSELPSSVMLEALQKKMTEVAMALKVKHSAHINGTPEECFHTQNGRNGRRSNMFSTREVAKIVLGPRDPPGSTLSAIMESVQPPSIEMAMAMTEAGDFNERGGGGSVIYPISEILIADKNHADGLKSSSPDRSTKQRRAFSAH